MEAELGAFLLRQLPALHAGARPLLEEIERTIHAGGKRLRPVFCYWGHLASGGEDSPAIFRAAAALELLHTFAIIHDDVMDRSTRRRGQPSSFVALGESARCVPHRGDPERLGVSAAILAGDLSLVLADRLLAESGFGPHVLEAALARYDAMRMRAVAGEYLDLVAAHRGEIDERQAVEIAALKSGGYTVADPLVIGALLAGAAEPGVQTLERYGHPLGVAFQLRDDVLGVFGDPERTGKDRDGDLREGKQTVLLATARALGDDGTRALLDELVGKPGLTGAEAERVRAIIRDTGALEATEDLIAGLALEASVALDRDILSEAAIVPLKELAGLVAARDF